MKIGSQQRYVEKESQLEDMLVRERIKDMDVTDRSGETHKLTEARYGRFTRVLHEFDGWVSRLREDFGPAAANFVVDHRLVEADAMDVEERSPSAMRTGTSWRSSSPTRTAPG